MNNYYNITQFKYDSFIENKELTIPKTKIKTKGSIPPPPPKPKK